MLQSETDPEEDLILDSVGGRLRWNWLLLLVGFRLLTFSFFSRLLNSSLFSSSVFFRSHLSLSFLPLLSRFSFSLVSLSLSFLFLFRFSFSLFSLSLFFLFCLFFYFSLFSLSSSR